MCVCFSLWEWNWVHANGFRHRSSNLPLALAWIPLVAALSLCVFIAFKSIPTVITICGIIYAKLQRHTHTHARSEQYNARKSIWKLFLFFDLIYLIKKQFDCNLTYRLRYSTHDIVRATVPHIRRSDENKESNTCSLKQNQREFNWKK